MAKLTIDGAAFHGFGLVRRDPLTFLGVAILLAGLGAALALIMIPAYAEFFSVLAATPAKGQQPDPQAALEAFSGFFGAIGLLYLAMIPIYMVVMGALYRSLVFGQSKGWVLGLKLGMDEVRAFLVTIVGSIVAMLPYIGVLIVTMIVAGVVGAAVAAGGGGESAAAAVAVPLIIIGYCVSIGLMIWVCVRLSYAAPASVGEGRFVIFESWGMTKGHFWKLFLAYLIVFVLVYLLELVIIGVIAIAASGWIASVNWENPDFSAFQTVRVGPVLIIGSLLYGLFATFFCGAFFGVASRGYVAWKEGTTAAGATTT